MKEELLIIECKKNKRQAQRQLFDAYYQCGFRLAIRYLGNHHDAEDVIMESFNRIFKGIVKFEFRGEGSLKKWINTLVINESLRFLKQRKLLQFEEDLEVYDNGQAEYFETDTIDPEEVRRLIGLMPGGYRTVFNLYAVEGFSHKDIAELLNISEGTSRSQLNKARKFIISRMESNLPYENI